MKTAIQTVLIVVLILIIVGIGLYLVCNTPGSWESRDVGKLVGVWLMVGILIVGVIALILSKQ